MKYIIIIAFLILSFSSQAAPLCSKNGTTVIYTNGVTTTRDDANIAMGKIDALGVDSQIDLKKVNDSILAYNYEESMARDFLEAAVQRFPSGYLRSLGVSNGYAAYMSFLSGGISDAIYAVAFNSIVDKIVEIQSDYLINYRSGSLYNKTVNEIKGHYEGALNRGERVFAISHSQGGLFMSDAFAQTAFSDKQKFFSGFQIASPLRDEMNSHFGYATHNKDNLINFVRATVGALPANVTAPFFLSNGYTGLKDYIIDYHLNHGVVTTYLYDSTIRSQLISKLVEAAQLLESNCPKAVINITNMNNLQVSFDSTGNSDLTGLTYAWNFDDGQVSAAKAPSQTYSVAGTYNVSLTVTDAYGASDTAQASVVVQSAVSNLTICNGGKVPITMSFTSPEIPSFTLEHINHYGQNASGNMYYISSTCECKSVSIPQGKRVGIHVEGYGLPDWLSSVSGIIPYDGYIFAQSGIQYFTVTTSVQNNLLYYALFKGEAHGAECQEYTYK